VKFHKNSKEIKNEKHDAALRIQKHYRGNKARSDLKTKGKLISKKPVK